ncbi:MAG TPA: NmrA family NAD(P)-binding protein [Flavisolibacter sp.]
MIQAGSHSNSAVANIDLSTKKTIILAGASGELGRKIAGYLIQNGARVKALVRSTTSTAAIDALKSKGIQVVVTDYQNVQQLAEICAGSNCVVSALSGLEDVIIDTQKRLLQAAIDAGVPRFIPSDYSIDYTKLEPGTNRNLDLRRTFNQHLDNTSIAATSLLNGMFTDLLKGQAPIILYSLKRVVYWGDADQPLDFTTLDDTAAYTAKAAVDSTTPRYLRIAGEVSSARGLCRSAGDISGQPFRLLRAGGLGGLKTMIKITRTLAPQKKEVFPPWQGMQYMHNMFTGLPKLTPLDNDRYPDMKWTSVADVIKTR